MGDIINFEQVRVTDRDSKEDDEVWQCACKCSLFYVLRDGFECFRCGKIAVLDDE